MADTLFKAPRAKKSPRQDDYEPPPAMAPKRPRTAEDFLLFCKFILDYENYEMLRHEELRAKSGSPMGSTGSSSDLSTSSRSEGRASQNDRKGSDTETDDDGYYLVTCYCGKPFAKRPMIECSNCLTWIHLSCAKIKKTNIPEVFICIKCRPQANQQLSPASQSPPTSVGSPSPPCSSSSLYTNGSSRSLTDKKGT